MKSILILFIILSIVLIIALFNKYEHFLNISALNVANSSIRNRLKYMDEKYGYDSERWRHYQLTPINLYNNDYM